jgi:hypothetical protein
VKEIKLAMVFAVGVALASHATAQDFSPTAFGWTVAGIGDANGDGVPDIAVPPPSKFARARLDS